MTDWIPPTSLEERLRETFVPGPLFLRYRLAKELRKGEREIHLVPYLVNPDRTAIDIGANQGVWTLQLARHCKHVHAFEPNPKIFRWLKRNVNQQNVTLSTVALSNESGSAELRVPLGRRGYSNQGASLSEQKVDGDHKTVHVETKRLDDLGLQDIGFIKIDVEGFELAVLEGARETIRASRPTLLMEMEERHTKQPIEEMLAEVEAYGYQTLAATRQGIRPAKHLNFDKEHRNPATRADYVFNFIFLPTDTPGT